MKHHQRTLGISDEWITPRWILQRLGRFDLDPCAAVNQPWPTADKMLTINDNGLAAEWSGRVWLNPPFNRYQRPQWMARMAEHNNGVMLVPAACETEAFRTFVFGVASAVCMVLRRPHFCTLDGIEAKANSGCTICLVAYGQHNAEVLKSSGLGAVLVEAT